MIRLRQYKNWILLLLGCTLYNNRTRVRWSYSLGRQVWSNKRRNRPYRLDHKGWTL